jgi:hypothetical protein
MAVVVTREFEGTRTTSVMKMNDVVEPIKFVIRYSEITHKYLASVYL